MADGKVTIAVDLDGKKAQGDINNLKSSLGNLGSTFKSVLGANIIGSALVGGIKAIGGGLVSMYSELNSSQKAWKTFEGNLQAFGRSADVIAGAKKEMQDFATKTIYSASDMASTYSQLDAVGTKNVGSLVKAFGGLAASAENPAQAMKSLSTQATQMASKPKVAWMDFRIMMEQAPAGMAAVAKEMGMSTDELVAAVQDGKVNTEEFFDAMNRAGNSDAFQKMATEFKTVDQAIDGAKESLANQMMPVFEKFNKFGIKAVNAVSDALGKVNFDKFASGLGSVLDKVDAEAIVAKVSGVISKVFSILQSAKAKVVEFYSIFKGTGAIAGAQKALEAVANAIGHVFSSLKGKGDLITPIAITLGDAFVKISGYIEDVANWIAKLDPGTIQAIASSVLGAVAAFKGFKTVSGILNGVSKSFGMIKAALSANPFMLAVVGLGALVGWFVQAYTTSETFRNKVNEVVSVIGKVAGKISEFVSGLDPSMFTLLIPALGLLLTKFKGFSALSKLNPFSLFKKNATDAFAGASGSATKSKGIIEQVFSGLGSLITSIAQGISTVLQGLATAISTVATGFGQAASMANPAQWLSMGAAMLMVGAGVALASAGIYVLVQAAIQLGSAGASAQIAMLALGVGIAALAGVFALLGPALTAGSVGIIAFGASVTLIGVGVYAASAGLSMLASHLPMIATYGASAAVGIAALGAGLVVMGAGALVAGAGLVVVGAGLAVVGAGAVVAAAGAIALGAGLLVAAAGIAAFGAALNVGKPGLTAFANAITKVVNAISGGFTSILNSVSGVIKSVGQAALNAGKGFNQLASGVVKITNTNLGDMAASLGAVAIGVGKIAGQSAGLAQAGSGMKSLGTGMTTVSTAATVAVAGLTMFVTRISTLSTTVGTLPAMMTTAASGFASFTAQAVSGVAGLSAINAPIATFKAQIMTITPALMTASAGFTSFGARAMVISAAFATVGGLITAFNARVMTISMTVTMASASFMMLSSGVMVVGTALMTVSAGFTQVGASATSASAQVNAMATSTQTVISAFNAMRGQVQSSMQAILSVITSTGSQMKSQGRQIGTQTVQNIAQGIRGGVGQSTSAMQALMNAVRSTGMAGVGSMRGIGAMIGQGLAQGMYSALGAVTAAANALVAQAERAAQAKAKIHSPSRLFRDNVGRYISQGVAVGIMGDAYKVDDAMGSMYDKIQAFSYKAEDIIGVGNSKLSKAVQVKSDLESAVKATVEVAKDKTNNLMEKALDIAEKAVDRPVETYLDGDTLVAKTGDRQKAYQDKQSKIYNRMRGIVT